LFALEDTQIEAHGRALIQGVMEIWQRNSHESRVRPNQMRTGRGKKPARAVQCSHPLPLSRGIIFSCRFLWQKCAGTCQRGALSGRL
jgi:hypothetical protein